MNEKVIKFLMALGTVLTAASELFRQYNQSKKYLEIERKLNEELDKNKGKSEND